MRERAPAGFKIFGGLGGMFLLEELRRGANGTMTGFAYPEAPIEVYRAHARGAADEAAAVFFRYLPLIRCEFQEGVGLAIRKHIYKLRGLIEHDCVRSPGVELDSGNDRRAAGAAPMAEARRGRGQCLTFGFSTARSSATERCDRLTSGIEGGQISEIEEPGALGRAAREIDATGLHVMPGAIDVHFHCRAPGESRAW